MVFRGMQPESDLEITDRTQVRVSSYVSESEYNPNSREGWVVKALGALGPSAIGDIQSWVTHRDGPNIMDTVWTMIDDGSLEAI